jgi:acyl-lipid omega-6 desaturase (Delta-12 desaturase)
MNKDTFLTINRELAPRFSMFHNLSDALANLAIFLSFGYLISLKTWPTFLLGQLLLGILITRSLFLMHECAHDTFSSNGRVNRLFGLWFGIFCFIPFPVWKFLHLKHHTYAGIREMDPLLVISAPKKASGVRKLIKTSVSFLWSIGFPIIELIRSIGYALSPIFIYMKTKDRKLILLSIFSALLVIAFWVGAHRLFPEIINFSTILPGVFLYLVINELVSLPQHLEMPSAEKSKGVYPIWEHAEVTRSVHVPSFIERHLFLNFNLHTEHHIFPKLPWRQLTEAQIFLRKELGDSYKLVPLSWSLRKRRSPFSELIALREK